MINHNRILIIIFFAITIFNCRNSNYLAREGIKNLHDGKKISALKFFEESLDKNRKNPIALYGKGKIMLESGVTLTLGQKLIENSLEKLEKKYQSDAYVSLAKSYVMTNLYDKAINLLESGLKKDISSPEIFRDLAFDYTQTMNYNKAKATFLKGCEVYTDNSEIYLDLSNFYIKIYNNYSLAIEALEKYKTKNNNNKEILLKLASLYYYTGKNDQAIQNLNLIKNLQGNESERKVTEEWIKQVQSGKWQIGKN